MAQTTVLSFLIASPENGTVIQLECTTKDWYLDFEDAAFITTLEATCTKNGWEYHKDTEHLYHSFMYSLITLISSICNTTE